MLPVLSLRFLLYSAENCIYVSFLGEKLFKFTIIFPMPSVMTIYLLSHPDHNLFFLHGTSVSIITRLIIIFCVIIVDFAVSSQNLVIPFLLCLPCRGKDVQCTNARCLSQTSLSHLKGLNRSTMIQCMNTMPWLAIQSIKVFLLL